MPHHPTLATHFHLAHGTRRLDNPPHQQRIHHGGQGWEYWYKTIDDVMKDRALGYTGSSGDQGDLDFTKLAATTQPGWGSHPAAPIASAQVLVLPKETEDEAAKGAFAFLNYYTQAKNTARWSMKTGYIPVRQSATSDPDYQAYTAKNPQALIPLKQAVTASPNFIDPTNGKILDALTIAADQVEIGAVEAAAGQQQVTHHGQFAFHTGGAYLHVGHQPAGT